MVALPSNVIYTRSQYFSELGIASDGDLTKVNTLDGHTAQTGDNYARLGAPSGASIAADIAENQTDLNTILADTDELQTNQGNWLTATGFSTHSAADVASAVLTTQMTESYNTDGTAPTLTQAVMLALQTLTEFAISGTTLTVKQLDGSTTAATFTLDDGTSPTSLTRAT